MPVMTPEATARNQMQVKDRRGRLVGRVDDLGDVGVS